jgi:hypothetical protein
MPMALRDSSEGLGLRQCVLATSSAGVKIRHNLRRMRLDPGLPVLCLLPPVRSRCLLRASDHDAKTGGRVGPSPQCRFRALGPALNSLILVWVVSTAFAASSFFQDTRYTGFALNDAESD